MRRSRRHAQSGFTLVEIAIVLVIIGLLLGGVLKG
ncbi:MAG: prepilin-type N-terminal cleavage/methylation domain-containing protein, partial [Burkholderiaceae bacterium]|nr:prepilin-type N-terminal cleavage/methylation domain-containing protein [Burkholderiaceae bacterium]